MRSDMPCDEDWNVSKIGDDEDIDDVDVYKRQVSLTLAGGDDHAPLQSDTPPEIDVEQGASYTCLLYTSGR